MPIEHRPTEDSSTLTATIGQAATVIATAITEYLGKTLLSAGQRATDSSGSDPTRPTPPAQSGQPFESLFGQYREALGDLAMALPRLARRASLAWQVEPGMRTVLRARPEVPGRGSRTDTRSLPDDAERELFAALAGLQRAAAGAAGVRVLLAPRIRTALRRAIDASLRRPAGSAGDGKRHQGRKKVLQAIESLLRHPDRRRLPTLLDRLKQEIRADREAGIRLAREQLAWLTDANLAAAFDVLDDMEALLGDECLEALLDRESVFAAFVEALEREADLSDDWRVPLQSCLRRLGYRTEGQLSAIVYLFPEPLNAAPAEAGGGPHRSERAFADCETLDEGGECVVFDHTTRSTFRIQPGCKVIFPPVGAGSADSEDLAPKAGGTPMDRALVTRHLREAELRATAEGHVYKDDHGLILPLRVHDACQGSAVWASDWRTVQEYLDSHFRSHAGIRMRAWDMGGGRTPVVLFAIHYRETDLQPCFELGLACVAAPRHDPLAVGTVVLDPYLVSHVRAEVAGRKIWGYPKLLAGTAKGSSGDASAAWQVTLHRSDASWRVPLPEGGHLDFRLPRGGTRASNQVPILTYTHRYGQWHRSVLMHSGTGESVRAGGSGVSCNVTGPAPDMPWWTQPGSAASLAGHLARFGIVRTGGATRIRTPIFTSWTEHLRSELGPPCLIPPAPEDSEY